MSTWMRDNASGARPRTGLNPLVQRALESRWNTAQPTDSISQLQAISARNAATPWGASTTGGGASGHTVNTGDPQIDRILQTIRDRESGGDYRVRNKHSSASGAYQFIDGTWNNYGGYARAYQAPPHVQDAKAREDIERFLAMSGGDVRAVPGMWYNPAIYQSGNWNQRPKGPGNPLTVAQYIDNWMRSYNSYG